MHRRKIRLACILQFSNRCGTRSTESGFHSKPVRLFEQFLLWKRPKLWILLNLCNRPRNPTCSATFHMGRCFQGRFRQLFRRHRKTRSTQRSRYWGVWFNKLWPSWETRAWIRTQKKADFRLLHFETPLAAWCMRRDDIVQWELFRRFRV